LSEIKEIRGISKECDQEVVRVLQLFPKWIPATHRGEIVRVRFVLPVKFEL
jgi:protein TonB